MQIAISEQRAIARGDKVDHSAVSNLIDIGDPEILQLIIFNKNTHDELKFKALKRIVNSDTDIFSLKTKKSLILKCLKFNNFGRKIYFEGNLLLKRIRQEQMFTTKSLIREHIQSILNLQKANEDRDFQLLSDEVNTLKFAICFKPGVSQGIRNPAFWNYIKMVRWSTFFEENEELQRSNNNLLLENLEPVLALEEWRQLDSLFDDPMNLDSLVYSSFHALAIEFHNRQNEVVQYTEEANRIIDNFEHLLSIVEKETQKAEEEKQLRSHQSKAAIQSRVSERLAREHDRPQKIGVSGVRFIASSNIYGPYDASVNNRWP